MESSRDAQFYSEHKPRWRGNGEGAKGRDPVESTARARVRTTKQRSDERCVVDLENVLRTAWRCCRRSVFSDLLPFEGEDDPPRGHVYEFAKREWDSTPSDFWMWSIYVIISLDVSLQYEQLCRIVL